MQSRPKVGEICPNFKPNHWEAEKGIFMGTTMRYITPVTGVYPGATAASPALRICIPVDQAWLIFYKLDLKWWPLMFSLVFNLKLQSRSFKRYCNRWRKIKNISFKKHRLVINFSRAWQKLLQVMKNKIIWHVLLFEIIKNKTKEEHGFKRDPKNVE